jgi:pimeloyl-ACP methyl ester carboxylesterase
VGERIINTNGVELHVVEAGDPGADHAVVLVHGFPELSYSWRHQIPALADAGHFVLAPDMRGYGRSSRPEAIEDYDIVHLTDDLVGVLDDVGRERAVFVGHDWGALVVWTLALLHPERVEGVVGMSVPFLPRGAVPPTQLWGQVFAGRFFYILYFQQLGPADADLARDPATTMRRLLVDPGDPGRAFDPAVSADDGRGFVDRFPEPDGRPSWLTEADLDHYVAEFTRTGFTGGLNWYRNFDRNWELTESVDGAKVTMPSLFVAGALDAVIAMSPPSVMDGHLDDHRGTVLVEGAGHWVQQERPDEVNAALLTFLDSLDRAEATQS